MVFINKETQNFKECISGPSAFLTPLHRESKVCVENVTKSIVLTLRGTGKANVNLLDGCLADG